MKVLSRNNLIGVESHDQFTELRKSVSEIDKNKIFEELFPIAIDYNGDGADAIASSLIISFDPVCNKTCEELLSEISNSKYNLSNREIPFYLVTQFGKHNLLKSIDGILNTGTLNEEQKTLVEGIKYWASFPPADSTANFHYWEWQEVIEGNNA